MEIYPLLFTPVYKDYLWGGQKILNYYKRKVMLNILAESWEISDREDGMSVVCNGPYIGMTLHELVQNFPKELIGKVAIFEKFPLLIKIIDATKKLSVQVHPDEIAAQKYNREAKAEAWYVIDIDEDAFVNVGFKHHINEKKLREALQDNTIENLLFHKKI